MNPDPDVPSNSLTPAPSNAPQPAAAQLEKLLFAPLPLMDTYERAEALTLQHKDPFYILAFLFLQWLQALSDDATTAYAEIKHPRKRALQTGQSWRAFSKLFAPFCEKFGYSVITWHLFRLSVSSKGDGNLLRKALWPLTIESRCNRDYLWFEPGQPLPPPDRDQDLFLRTLVRWCDWLDAQLHLWAHSYSHTAPALFDPDPETRFLAALGDAQRHLACLGPYGRSAWLHDLSIATKLFHNSPKWAAVGKAMSDDSQRSWQYPELDTMVILLWPLVKSYNWTYRDLLNTLRPGLKRPKAYPCDTEQNFSAYCLNVLGLRKTGRGRTAKNERPRGYEIAVEYLELEPERAAGKG